MFPWRWCNPFHQQLNDVGVLHHSGSLMGLVQAGELLWAVVPGVHAGNRSAAGV